MANRKKLGSPNPATLKNSTKGKAHPLPPLTYPDKSPHIASSPGKPGGGTLYLPKILIGHRDSTVDFYMDTLNRMLELPADERPDTIIISDPLNHAKEPHGTPGGNIEAELRHAAELLEKALETGANVIYDMSHTDGLADHLQLNNETIGEV